MIWNESLKKLRAAIGAECELRMKRNGELNTEQIAKWLITHERKLTFAGLADLVCQVMEQRNDDKHVERVLKAKPELRKWEPGVRQLSETLGVPLWYLLGLDEERSLECHAAAILIHKLRAEEGQATVDAMKALQELLHPVMDGHPEMTVGEATVRLQQQTNETIRRLDGEAS